MRKRFHLAGVLLCLVTACPATAHGETADHAELVQRIDASLAAACTFMLDHQAEDGGWYSDRYGCFRTGPTLTPYVMSALWFMPQAGPEAPTAYRRGVSSLTRLVGEDGKLDVGRREWIFPVYTSAMASRVVVLQERTDENLRAQQAWLEYLLARQLTEDLGWRPEDLEYGGWGFALDLPRKPPPGRPKEFFHESNLAATVFGLAALKSARTPRDHPAYAKALRFVKRCQNFAETADAADPDFDDGGFFFIPADPVQNKAGVAGTDRRGRQRYHSYGTMTADGIRALMSAGLPPDHPRVVAARRWLEKNFSAKENPGAFPGDRAVLQNATYYYWTWAVAHAFMALRVDEFETASGERVQWPVALAEEVLRRQRPDGAWVNRFTDAKEDDPLVATPWAAASLAICRSMITHERPVLGK